MSYFQNLTLIAVTMWPTVALSTDHPEKRAIAKALGYLAREATLWREEHGCVSCHHAALVVWALAEAKQAGYRVDDDLFRELAEWIASTAGDGKTSQPRPATVPNALNTKAIYWRIALNEAGKTLGNLGNPQRLTETILEDQTATGEWLAWPDTRPPIFGDSNDSMTSLATFAISPDKAQPAGAARERALRWLETHPPDSEMQSLSFRIVLAAQQTPQSSALEKLIRRCFERQHQDGGWSQCQDMTSDAWATGQAIYALSIAGINPADTRIKHAQRFLLQEQQADGSWRMISRPTQSSAGGANLKPITAAGTAWGVIGLIRSPSAASKR